MTNKIKAGSPVDPNTTTEGARGSGVRPPANLEQQQLLQRIQDEAGFLILLVERRYRIGEVLTNTASGPTPGDFALPRLTVVGYSDCRAWLEQCCRWFPPLLHPPERYAGCEFVKAVAE